jgi:uncharacterized protein (DUF342 family)
MSVDTKANIKIELRMDEADLHLIAAFESSKESPPIDAKWVQNYIRQSEFDVLALDTEAINSLVSRYLAGEEQGEVTVGQRKGAECEVQVAADASTATLTSHPPQGGPPLSMDQIEAALNRAGVIHGIDSDALQQVLTTPAIENLTVARATPAVNGKDGYFERVSSTGSGPIIDDKGQADYREIDLMGLVAAGAPLLRRISAEHGTPGINVLGLAIPAISGKEVMFSNRLEHVIHSPDDHNVLIAEVAGKPDYFDNGVNIDPNLQLKEVGLHTGNIHYEGDIAINGDVATGMKVTTTGNVSISGAVEAATIEVDGDITVRGGIIGHGEVTDTRGTLPAGIAQIICSGTVRARFVRNAWIEADTIEIVDLAAHSVLKATTKVEIGTEKSPKGHLYGGITVSGREVAARVLGANTSAKTTVVVGTDIDIEKRLQALDAEEALKAAEKDKLITVLTSLERFPPEKRNLLEQRVAATLKQLEETFAGIQTSRNELKSKQQLANDVVVRVGLLLNSGVSLKINHMQTLIRDEHGPCTIHLQGGSIAFDSEPRDDDTTPE